MQAFMGQGPFRENGPVMKLMHKAFNVNSLPYIEKMQSKLLVIFPVGNKDLNVLTMDDEAKTAFRDYVDPDPKVDVDLCEYARKVGQTEILQAVKYVQCLRQFMCTVISMQAWLSEKADSTFAKEDGAVLSRCRLSLDDLTTFDGTAAAIAADTRFKGWEHMAAAGASALDGGKALYQSVQECVSKILEVAIKEITDSIPNGWEDERDKVGSTADVSKTLLNNTEHYPKLSPASLRLSTAVDWIENSVHKATQAK